VNNMSKQFEVLKRASLFLEEHGREKQVADILLQFHLGLSRSEFLMNMREQIQAHVEHLFETDIKKHAATGIPVQHLIGYEAFYGRNFHVNKHVLIPRMETEELIEHILNQTPKDKPLTIVDAGVGSGIIAITLALELPKATVFGTDLSEEALRVARQNADALDANVHFLQGNFLAPLIEQERQADIVVSNPPYIAETERTDLSDTVKNFDPGLALFAEEDGLAAYKEIIRQLPRVARKDSCFVLEIGNKQAEAVTRLIQNRFPESDVRTIQDINKNDRIISTRL